MSWKQLVEDNNSDGVLEAIKGEIRTQLQYRGVSVSSINIQMNPDSISLIIGINESKRQAQT